MALKAQKDTISQNLLNEVIGTQSSVNPGGPPGRKSINRGSVTYEKQILGSGEDISELKIENDRMKTTIMILSQKLKMKNDDNNEDLEKIRGEINIFKEKNETLKQINDDLEKEIDLLKSQDTSKWNETVE